MGPEDLAHRALERGLLEPEDLLREPAQDAADPVAALLDRYELVEHLGEGGSGGTRFYVGPDRGSGTVEIGCSRRVGRGHRPYAGWASRPFTGSGLQKRNSAKPGVLVFAQNCPRSLPMVLVM